MTHPADQTAATTRPGGSPLASLRRADALVLGGALLVFVFSFLPQLHVSVGGFTATASMWHERVLVEVLVVPLLTLVIAALTLLPVLRPERAEAPLLVAPPLVIRDVFAVIPFVSAIFALFSWHSFGGIGYAAYVEVIATLAVAVGALGTPYLPQLAEPLQGSPRRQQDEQAAGGYAPPAGWGQQAPAPGSGPLPADAGSTALQPQWGAAETSGEAPGWQEQPPGQPLPPAATETIIAPQHVSDFREPETVAPVAAPAPAPTDPFWACFPTVRPLVDAMSGAPVGEVTPEEWYLVTAIDGRGATVQTTDGRSGLLGDVSGMVRADG